MPRYWIVVCPVERLQNGSDRVRDRLWDRWYNEKCVAIGWGPQRGFALNGPTDDSGWTFVRNRLKDIQIGDKVIPFTKNWRIGPVGTVTDIAVSDQSWQPTILAGETSDGKPSLGRRIRVEWERTGMPPNGRQATVPVARRTKAPLSRRAIMELSNKRFHELCAFLADSSNWTDV